MKKNQNKQKKQQKPNPNHLQKDYVKNDVVENNPEPGIGMWYVTKNHFVDNLTCQVSVLHYYWRCVSDL